MGFRRTIIVFLVLAALCVSSPSISAQTLVLYQKEEFENNPILDGVVKGVRNKTPNVVLRSYRRGNFFARTFDVESKFDNVIVLGRTAIRDFSISGIDADWVGGGYEGDLNIDQEERVKSVSLNIGPPQVFKQIRDLKESVKTLHMVVTESGYDRYIINAKNISKKYNIELKVYRASNIRSTARIWFNILKVANASDDALWMVTEQYNEESGSFKYVTEEAWKKKILTLTTVGSLAPRGFAFGYILNPEAYGEQLYTKIDQNNEWTPTNGFMVNAMIESYTRVLNQRVIQRLNANLPSDIDQLPNRDVVVK